jgi:hypothetical protein
VWSRQDAPGPHCGADFMVGCRRSTDPGALCVRLPIFGRVCWRSGIEHRRRRRELACRGRRTGKRRHVEGRTVEPDRPSTLSSMPSTAKFCARRHFVSNAEGIVVMALKLCQQGNAGPLIQRSFSQTSLFESKGVHADGPKTSRPHEGGALKLSLRPDV